MMTKARNTRRPFSKKLTIEDSKKIGNLYWKQCRPVSEIAEDFRVSTATVYVHIHKAQMAYYIKHNISNLTTEMHERYLYGANYIALAVRYGISPRQVRRIVSEWFPTNY